MTEDPSRFGPGHLEVARIVREALSLSESQAFALRKDRDDHASPTWLGLHAYATWEMARRIPEVTAWIDAAEASAEAAVWWVADSWSGEPLSRRAGRSTAGMAAKDAAKAAVFAARSAALAAVTVHLIGGHDGTPSSSEHATLAAAWRAVFPAEDEVIRGASHKESV